MNFFSSSIELISPCHLESNTSLPLIGFAILVRNHTNGSPKPHTFACCILICVEVLSNLYKMCILIKYESNYIDALKKSCYKFN